MVIFCTQNIWRGKVNLVAGPTLARGPHFEQP